MNRAAHVVQLVVVPSDAVGQARVGLDQRVETAFDHVLGSHGHRAKVERHVHAVDARQVQDALGDVLGQVAHPFQIVIDLQYGHDEPQVDGHRLV